MSNAIAGRVVIMGGPYFSGPLNSCGPLFESINGLFRFEARLFAVPASLEFRFQAIEFDVDIPLKSAFRVARDGENQFRQLAPRLLENGLANVDENMWRAVRELIPESQINGFNQSLNLRHATEHPIYEAARTRRFAQFLAAARENPGARLPLLRAAGDLMIQSHFSLDHRWKIRSSEADGIVKTARETPGVYGARLVIGGRGPGVITLCEN